MFRVQVQGRSARRSAEQVDGGNWLQVDYKPRPAAKLPWEQKRPQPVARLEVREGPCAKRSDVVVQHALIAKKGRDVARNVDWRASFTSDTMLVIYLPELRRT